MDVAPGRAVIRQRGKLDARLPAFGDVEVGRRSEKKLLRILTDVANATLPETDKPQ